MRRWYVYILRCCDGTLYTGIAADVRKRLEAHRRGVAAKYTRSRRPVMLAYQECQPDRSSALKREVALRRMGRAGKLVLIASRRSRRARELRGAPQRDGGKAAVGGPRASIVMASTERKPSGAGPLGSRVS